MSLAHKQFNTYVHNIESNVATNKLLAQILPNSNWININIGRYNFLKEEIEQRPEFFKKLLHGNNDLILDDWAAVLKKNKSNVQFLHGLAVIYREHALNAPAHDESSGNCWFFSTMLWALLFCTEEFWNYFSIDRITDRNTGDRLPLEPEQQETLMMQALEGILSLHSSIGSRELNASRYDNAQIHLQCLDICRKGEAALLEELCSRGIFFELNPVEKRIQKLKNTADEILDDVCVTLVREAEKHTSDAEAIKALPEGIRKNYDGGIQHLKAFILMDIPNIRVFRKSLEWYNEWCYDLYVTSKMDQVKELMKPAIEIADVLITMCTKGNAYTPENQALSQHFLFRGFTSDDPENALSDYEEALAWNVANENAKQLLGDAYHAIVMKQMDRAIECMQQKKYDEGYEILNSIEEQVKDQEADMAQINQARSILYFNHANNLANDGKFREALTLANKSLQLMPQQVEIQKLVDEMEEYAPEENNLNHLKAARESMDKERYDYAIKSAEKVHSDSRFYSDATRLQALAYFQRGIDRFKKERFDKAIDDLEISLTLLYKKEEQKVVIEQLEIVRQAKLGKSLQKAYENKDWDKVENVLRKELNSQSSAQANKEIKRQLSIALNAHAIDLLNEVQASEQMFAEAMNDIMNRVRQQPGVKS